MAQNKHEGGKGAGGRAGTCQRDGKRVGCKAGEGPLDPDRRRGAQALALAGQPERSSTRAPVRRCKWPAMRRGKRPARASRLGTPPETSRGPKAAHSPRPHVTHAPAPPTDRHATCDACGHPAGGAPAACTLRRRCGSARAARCSPSPADTLSRSVGRFGSVSPYLSLSLSLSLRLPRALCPPLSLSLAISPSLSLWRTPSLSLVLSLSLSLPLAAGSGEPGGLA